jgi:hypothetical protein
MSYLVSGYEPHRAARHAQVRQFPPRATASAIRETQNGQCLAADAQAFDDFLVASLVLGFDVVEETAAQTDHLEQAAPGMIVFFMHLEVVGQSIDAFGEKRDLDLG